MAQSANSADSASEIENSDVNSENEEKQLLKSGDKGKKEKRGIIYLSTIPKFMNVTKVREIFGEYGEIDRVFLQPEEQHGQKNKRKKKPAKHFTEGWVEFKKKKVAKLVAAHLNNKQIGGRKRSKFYDHIWNIKYLPRFKWVHLSERLAYERAVHKQRMNTEISQAKREANFFSQNVDLSERLSKRKVKGGQEAVVEDTPGEEPGLGAFVRQYRQRDLDSEIRERKLAALNADSVKIKKKKKVAHKKEIGPLPDAGRKDLLKSLFGSRS
ncbi:activator of basal transcription 1-like [Thrips palmi]|uniref:Activator of basal transcription 1 n=1 Tax=Thrips palmi TaxID=161013 RepID=A0A6P9A4J1_THRPL|nr:activator of basal transcription 1-like [Thrips palmi]